MRLTNFIWLVMILALVLFCPFFSFLGLDNVSLLSLAPVRGASAANSSAAANATALALFSAGAAGAGYYFMKHGRSQPTALFQDSSMPDLWGRRRAAQNVIISFAKGDIRGALNTIWEQIKHEWDELWKSRNISSIPFLSDALRWIGSNDIGNTILYYGFGISVHKDGRVETSIGDTLLNLLMFVGLAGAVVKVFSMSERAAATATRVATIASKTGTIDRSGATLIKAGTAESRVGLLSKIKKICKEMIHITPHERQSGWVPHIHVLSKNIRQKYWTEAVVNKIFFGEPGKVGGLLRKWGILRDKFLTGHWVERMTENKISRAILHRMRSLIGGPFMYIGNLIAHPINPFFGRTAYRLINSSNRDLQALTYPVNLKHTKNFSRKLSFALNNSINVVKNFAFRTGKSSGSIGISNRISSNVAKAVNSLSSNISKSSSSSISYISIKKNSNTITKVVKNINNACRVVVNNFKKSIKNLFSGRPKGRR